MVQSLVQIYVHLVFSTKHREPLLSDPKLRAACHAYLGGICRKHDSPPLIVGGVEDHVHLLTRLAKTIDVASVVREVKRDSSKWIKTESTQLASFRWQAGYGAFSVSPTHVDTLIKYIEHQEERHRTETYQDEFRMLCQQYGLEIDERYVWD